MTDATQEKIDKFVETQFKELQQNITNFVSENVKTNKKQIAIHAVILGNLSLNLMRSYVNLWHMATETPKVTLLSEAFDKILSSLNE